MQQVDQARLAINPQEDPRNEFRVVKFNENVT